MLILTHYLGTSYLFQLRFSFISFTSLLVGNFLFAIMYVDHDSPYTRTMRTIMDASSSLSRVLLNQWSILPPYTTVSDLRSNITWEFIILDLQDCFFSDLHSFNTIKLIVSCLPQSSSDAYKDLRCRFHLPGWEDWVPMFCLC